MTSAKKRLHDICHTGMFLAGIHCLEWYLVRFCYFVIDGFWSSPE